MLLSAILGHLISSFVSSTTNLAIATLGRYDCMFDCRQTDVIRVILIYFSDVIVSFPGPTHLPSLAVWKVGGAYEQDSWSHHVIPAHFR